VFDDDEGRLESLLEGAERSLRNEAVTHAALKSGGGGGGGGEEEEEEEEEEG
jgi:hypothetical protein